MHGKTFRSIEEVTAPRMHVGQRVECLSSGRWVPCEITRIVMRDWKEGRRRVWGWAYHVTVNGVHVNRYGADDQDSPFALRPVAEAREEG